MSRPPEPWRAGELRLAPESIEALEWWGVGRRWVYDHADYLGAKRLGAGKRPRLRFDPTEVADRLGPPDPKGGSRAR